MKSQLVKALIVASVLAMLLPLASFAKDRSEILRYEVTWNGSKAGHG
ncbi:MAG: hypothetical protein QG663_462, partial [Thermodesulfobacteriota bacterium]|nr:hypothetical protein [Thermodesulfobacteriota bacterium]